MAGRDQNAEGAFQVFGGNRLENMMTGRMAGRAPTLDAEHLQPFRRQPAAPAVNRPEIVRSRRHRRQRKHQDRGKLIAAPLPGPVVRHPRECGPKRSHPHHPLQGGRAWNPHRPIPQCGGLNHPDDAAAFPGTRVDEATIVGYAVPRSLTE